MKLNGNAKQLNLGTRAEACLAGEVRKCLSTDRTVRRGKAVGNRSVVSSSSSVFDDESLSSGCSSSRMRWYFSANGGTLTSSGIGSPRAVEASLRCEDVYAIIWKHVSR